MKRTKKFFNKLETKEILLYNSSVDYLDNHIVIETLDVIKCDNSLLENKQ